MTTFDPIRTRINALKLANQKGLRLSKTPSGYLVRQDGRIIKQSFSIYLICQYLETLP